MCESVLGKGSKMMFLLHFGCLFCASCVKDVETSSFIDVQCAFSDTVTWLSGVIQMGPKISLEVKRVIISFYFLYFK